MNGNIKNDFYIEENQWSGAFCTSRNTTGTIFKIIFIKKKVYVQIDNIHKILVNKISTEVLEIQYKKIDFY